MNSLLNPVILAYASDAKSGGKFQAPPTFCWMPAGVHTISASRGDRTPITVQILCDERGANAVRTSFRRAALEGKPAWIDFNHEDSEAAAWVHDFFWMGSVGIMCRVEWTPAGEQALRERRYVSFSPTFIAEREHTPARVAGLFEGHAAGGIVNAPAFGRAMPSLAPAAPENRIEAQSEARLAYAHALQNGDFTTAAECERILLWR